MNVHPIIVHFPIAFLSVYSLTELVRLRYITSSVYWFYIKAFLVITGAAGAAAAYLSGEVAQELLSGGGSLQQLIEVHSRWAKGTTILFGSIAVIYAIAWISRLEMVKHLENYMKLNEQLAYQTAKRAVNYLVNSFIMIIPALVGLVCVLVTGALGGAIVYGPDADPFVRIIYNLVFGG